MIAAVNGHAFAGGAMLALACDQRVMRDDRGYFCLPEVDINIPFSDGMSALVRAKLSPKTSSDAMLTGRRWTAAEALEGDIVDATAPEAEVLPIAIARAKELSGKTHGVVGTIKQTMYAKVTEALAEPVII